MSEHNGFILQYMKFNLYFLVLMIHVFFVKVECWYSDFQTEVYKVPHSTVYEIFLGRISSWEEGKVI